MTLQWPFGGHQTGTRSRLIFALEVPTIREAQDLAARLVNEVGMFKIGKQLFLHAGPQIVRDIRGLGGEVFLDLKFHDIPRTVAKAGVEAARMHVRMFDLHASGSLEMMQRTVAEVGKTCRAEGLRKPKVLAVTVLTSLNREDLKRVGVMSGVESQVVRLARLARMAGMDGAVTSPVEITRIRKECGRGFIIVAPGVRGKDNDVADPQRVMTTEDAIRAGADYIVVGRPIRDAPDPVAAARDVVASMEQGLATGEGRVRLFRERDK